MLENLSKIEVKSAVDLIIYQIRELIKSGAIKSGDKLPPDRKLAEHFGASKSQVREALNKLKVYGIINISPQGGITVNGIGMVALESLLTDILDIEKPDFISLVDTRILLEIEAARLAAIHRTEKDITIMSKAIHKFEEKSKAGHNAVEQDLLFHIKIAEASGNSVLKSLMMIITPDIIKNFKRLRICDDAQLDSTAMEHRMIYNAIVDRDSDAAVEAMRYHLNDIKNFSI